MADLKNQSSPILVILCTIGLLAFLLLVIYPNYRNMKEYDRQISALKREIALRQSLAPLYAKLIEKVRIAPSVALSLPDKTKLDIENASRLTQLFQTIAQHTDLTLESVTPDAQAVEQGDGRLKIDVVFRGDFLNVQPLINTIVEKSFVERIVGIQIQSTERNKWIKLSVSLLHR
jgi:hypothetical protein